MKDVFAYIRKNSSREFLLRASYLEIYNEQLVDLLAPSSLSQPSITEQGLVGAREEVVTSLRAITEVIERGEANRRTASTDWNSRSSRSHSVFRLVCAGAPKTRSTGTDTVFWAGYRVSRSLQVTRVLLPTNPEPLKCPHYTKLDSPANPWRKDGPIIDSCELSSSITSFSALNTTVFQSLIDLAGSEKATSDKERTNEGKYINTR
jgi:centromeric protein E